MSYMTGRRAAELLALCTTLCLLNKASFARTPIASEYISLNSLGPSLRPLPTIIISMEKISLNDKFDSNYVLKKHGFEKLRYYVVQLSCENISGIQSEVGPISVILGKAHKVVKTCNIGLAGSCRIQRQVYSIVRKDYPVSRMYSLRELALLTNCTIG